MFVDWMKVKKALYPMKDYEDLACRLQHSFSYPFVRQTFNMTMPALADYTRLSVGADPKDRYNEYATRLTRIFTDLQDAGVTDLLELYDRVRTREGLGNFEAETHLEAADVVSALKFLVYWFVPMEKPLMGLIKDDPILEDAVRVLREKKAIRSNLDLLQQGLTPEARKALAESTDLEPEVVHELVNRADFSRMPWASKATISNIIGAGCKCLYELANADPDKLYADFFDYGKSIGKNLKFGNEIENSYRIARIVPVLLK